MCTSMRVSLFRKVPTYLLPQFLNKSEIKPISVPSAHVSYCRSLCGGSIVGGGGTRVPRDVKTDCGRRWRPKTKPKFDFWNPQTFFQHTSWRHELNVQVKHTHTTKSTSRPFDHVYHFASWCGARGLWNCHPRRIHVWLCASCHGRRGEQHFKARGRPVFRLFAFDHSKQH